MESSLLFQYLKIKLPTKIIFKRLLLNLWEKLMKRVSRVLKSLHSYLRESMNLLEVNQLLQVMLTLTLTYFIDVELIKNNAKLGAEISVSLSKLN